MNQPTTMFADISKPPAPLPTAELTTPRQGVSLLPPLSRRGYGPGLIILTRRVGGAEGAEGAGEDGGGDSLRMVDGNVPSPLMKWAEEGYAVVQLDERAFRDASSSEVVVREAAGLLDACAKCEPKGKIGLVAYDTGIWNEVASGLAGGAPGVVACVVHADTSALGSVANVDLGVPVLCHVAGTAAAGTDDAKEKQQQQGIVTKLYRYPNAESGGFATPGHAHFRHAAESLAHARSLQFLKPCAGGPYFDLEAVWEEHTYYEFADRSVEHTMSTMVQEPYVNHVPTVTGGVGREKLTSFYRHNFIFNNSADTELELISRTVGINTVVDEFIFKFTHDRGIDWLLPGVPPTNLTAQVPFTAVVNIRGDRLCHEHISWDQGTVLRQLGLLPEYLPFPHELPSLPSSSSPPSSETRRPLEYRVPVAGAETAEKMRDRNGAESNLMFTFGARERRG